MVTVMQMQPHTVTFAGMHAHAHAYMQAHTHAHTHTHMHTQWMKECLHHIQLMYIMNL